MDVFRCGSLYSRTLRRSSLSVLLGSLCLALIAGPSVAQAKPSETPVQWSTQPQAKAFAASSKNSVLPRFEEDQEFLVYGMKALGRISLSLVALPGTSAPTAKDGLRGRAFLAGASCFAQTLIVSKKIPIGSGWWAILKQMARAHDGKAISKAFTSSKLVSMQLLEASLIEEGLDLVGSHACGEFRMWVNLLINSARSILEHGKTHMGLWVRGTDWFTGLKIWTCEVQPFWGPDLDDRNWTESTYYLDTWWHPEDDPRDACPTPQDDWHLPLKRYALLWQS